jgi:hypothetical protein
MLHRAVADTDDVSENLDCTQHQGDDRVLSIIILMMEGGSLSVSTRQHGSTT